MSFGERNGNHRFSTRVGLRQNIQIANLTRKEENDLGGNDWMVTLRNLIIRDQYYKMIGKLIKMSTQIKAR